MLSEDILTDEEFNGLTLEAQNLFLRMLAKADDCGVVPANDYTLTALINPPVRVRKNLRAFLVEIVDHNLGRLIEYQGKEFFTFKPESFIERQGHILNKRTRSEYLKISADEYDSGKFPEVPRNSTLNDESVSSVVDSRKQRVESREYKAESRKRDEFVAPTVDEVVAYFQSKGFPESTARRAFEYYNDAEWVDSHGHKVRNWKQKMLAVWMKEENRNGASQNHQSGNSRGGKKSSVLPGDVELAAELATRINTVRSGT